jgi:hypothetical protein
MKSCRNCTRSVHDGYFHVSLKCNATGALLGSVSKNPDENKQYDANVIAYAANCNHYIKEGATNETVLL